MPAEDEDDTPPPGEAGAGPPEPLAPGSEPTEGWIIGGRYELEARIADGGMASVWRGRDRVLGRTVAIKILHDHLSADESLRERFRREAVAAAKLTHAHIVGLYDTGSEGRRVFLVMEHVEGPTLREVLDDVGMLDPAEAAGIAEHVARALAYAHDRGLVHRDVKPGNILLTSDGLVKVTDFGIAKAEAAGEDLTRTGVVLGTAAYVSPEQVLGEEVDGRADQYALGCVLYELLTGQRAFTGDSPLATAAARLEHEPLPPRSLRPGLPRGLDEIALRALSRRPEDRFASTTHLADALAAYATEALPDVSEVPSVAAAAAPDGAGAPATADVVAELAWHDDTNVLLDGDWEGGDPWSAGTRRESFLRSEGRWLLLSVGLLALIGVLVGTGLATGVLETGEGFPLRWAGDGGQRWPAELIPVQDIALFDPEGSGSESGEDLVNVLDGDDGTAWRSVGYNTPAFGDLKSGVGFWVDLGGPHAIRDIAVRTTTPGIAYEIRVAEEPASMPEGWRPIARVSSASPLEATRFREPVVTRYLLVWVTGELQPEADGARHRAGFSGLAVRGAPR